MNNMNPLGMINPMNNMNPLGMINSMNNMNPMGMMNPMNNMNPIGMIYPMNNMNPMGMINPIGMINAMGMINPIDMINPMNNMNSMNNVNIENNMDMIMDNTMFPNSPCMNDLNNIDNNDIDDKNCKSIKLYYEDEFIANVTLFINENPKEKFKSILYSLGKKDYRPAFTYEIIERENPNETLEFLIERGVVEPNPWIVIINKSRNINYSCSKFDFNDIKNGDKLQVKYGGVLYGAGGMCDIEFVDIDELTKKKKIPFIKDAQKWRRVSIGLNLFGKCINKNCQAFNQEVIYMAGINNKFDFNLCRKNIICPICSKNFLPITMGFWRCEYQIKGEKFKNGDYEEININGKETFENDFEYFDPNSNDTVSWSYLTIFTGHRQKMKYKEKTV